MFELCLFDLDETLIRTDDLKDIRESCKNSSDQNLLQQVIDGLETRDDRHIYKLATLKKIRVTFPQLKLGVFTRSPRSYALKALAWAYPDFDWDIVIAYEDVRNRKPHGDGIALAMDQFGIEYLDRVIVVGDSDVDVRSAYNCGCVVALDKSSWPHKWTWEHWAAQKHIPDAFISAPEALLDVLQNPVNFLPELERSLAGGKNWVQAPRFEKINHFVAQAAEADNAAYPIHVCGRSFANYPSLSERRKWHDLTHSIEKHKNSTEFPDEWISVVRRFIEAQYPAFFGPKRIIVSVVPHRPGREPRLEHFLNQLEASLIEEPIKHRTVSVEPQLLAYKDGVRSQHHDHLNMDQRFVNVRDNLIVANPGLIDPLASYLIIDDVTTTGASLIYAYK